MNNNALVILSGGQDSTTVLFLALMTYDTVHALTVDYGQRHAVEINAASQVWERARKAYPDTAGRHEILSLPPNILESTSPLTDPNVPLAFYASVADLPGGIEKTFVPMRNTLLLTLAVNRALALGADNVLTGLCEEDYGGYPDCRNKYLKAMQAATDASTEGVGQVHFFAPLMHLTKKQTVKLARRLPHCWPALALSHTCYAGEGRPCGVCHACLLRARGFAEARLLDPLLERHGIYQAPVDDDIPF